jgi:hypothetical protein
LRAASFGVVARQRLAFDERSARRAAVGGTHVCAARKTGAGQWREEQCDPGTGKDGSIMDREVQGDSHGNG